MLQMHLCPRRCGLHPRTPPIQDVIRACGPAGLCGLGVLKITGEVKKKNVEADLGALVENETQKLGPGWFYLKMIVISSLPVDFHVKTFIPQARGGRGSGAHWDPWLARSASAGPQLAGDRGAGPDPQPSALAPQAPL